MKAITMSEIEQAHVAVVQAYQHAREIEQHSERSEVYPIAGREVTFTWRTRCFDCDGQPCREAEVVCGPWWLTMAHDVGPGLQGAQGISVEPQIIAFEHLIRDRLNALDSNAKWPDTLAEMGIK